MNFCISFGDPDGTLSARLQDPLRTGLPRVPPENFRRDSLPQSDCCGSRQGPSLENGILSYIWFGTSHLSETP